MGVRNKEREKEMAIRMGNRKGEKKMRLEKGKRE